MSAKTTIKVADVLERANVMMNSDNLDQGQKDGISMLLDSILKSTGTYNGYYHKTSNPTKDEEYSRHYLVHRKLQKSYYEFSDERKNSEDGMR